MRKIFSLHPPMVKIPEICCDVELRFVPGKRQVFEGIWDNRKVIVKTFLHKLHSYRHMKREWDRLKVLQTKHILAPVPLLQGQDAKNHFCLVTKKIENAVDADKIWLSILDQEAKKKFIIKILKIIVQHHQAQILQQDLHLGNFLVQGEHIYTIDPSQIQIFRSPIPRYKCLFNVALLVSQHLCLLDCVDEIMQQYADMRNWSLSESEKEKVKSFIYRCKKKRIQKTLQKYQRQNSRHHFISEKHTKAIVDTVMGTQQQAKELVENIENLMDNSEYLKEGGTAYVGQAKWLGNDIIIKRYNYKNLWYSFRQTFKKRRGKNSWIAGHHLELLNIPTAKPLAYIEKYKFGLFEKSYIIMEYIAHQNFESFFKNDQISFEKKISVAEKVLSLLNELHLHQISHGDLKYMNILIANEKPILIDLDSMIFYGNTYKDKYKYKDKRKKDIQRFLANINQFPQLEPFFGEKNAKNHKSLHS